MVDFRSTICSTGAHCNACRNDAAWLMNASRFYAGAPGVGVVAPCGRPWGWQGEGEPIITPEQREEIIAQRREACDDCEQSVSRGVDASGRERLACKLLDRHKPCVLARRINDIFARCPAEKWSAIMRA